MTLFSTDYFTKSVEAEPLANIRDVDAKIFVWKNTFTQFGIPHTLILDNGLQFDSRAFRRSIGETPFSMTYGVEAVIPLETGFPTLRTNLFTPDNNDNLLEKSLDLIEERRENVMGKHKQRYDSSVKLRPLASGDLVLRKVVGVAKNLAWGKLGPNWEKPYLITSVAGISAYFLEDLDENVVPHPRM
ncbi:uncharacterized protein LOC142635883 [Castanea sativa]|uniref:uncharacterized protein LOC142635883 n=1 Tax=Castanea sativa TaxID=21020 RepID=UPI003F64BCDF